MYFIPSQVEDEIPGVQSRAAGQRLFPDLSLSLIVYLFSLLSSPSYSSHLQYQVHPAVANPTVTWSRGGEESESLSSHLSLSLCPSDQLAVRTLTSLGHEEERCVSIPPLLLPLIEHPVG